MRLTVSRSVSLGVEPHLGLMTRYLLLFDSYCLVFVGGGPLSDVRTGLSFVYVAGPCQHSPSRIRVRWDSWPYFTVSELRLPVSSPPTTRRVTVEVFNPASTQNGWSAPYIGSAQTNHRKHINCSTTDIVYCCQACPPMHCLAMVALLLCIRCCDMCLLVCYQATLWANPLQYLFMNMVTF
jgi:hypothetical protein